MHGGTLYNFYYSSVTKGKLVNAKFFPCFYHSVPAPAPGIGFVVHETPQQLDFGHGII